MTFTASRNYDLSPREYADLTRRAMARLNQA
jgi:hypothetical protein